jgi:glycosyltransferase involved in cell wall biosynthesis
MRVLHLTPEFPPVIWGGLGTAVGGLVNASARSGLSVGVLLVGGALVLDRAGEGGYGYGRAWQGRPTVPVATNAAGVRFFHVQPDQAVAAALALVADWEPDVIHLHTSWLWHVAEAMREVADIPVVMTVHSLDRLEYEHGTVVCHWQMQEAAMAAATRVIAISQSEETLIDQHCPETRGRVRVVGNGIDDTSDARSSVRRSRADSSPTVLYSGRFVDRKGIHELLEAIPVVLRQAPSVRFVLAGGYGGGAEIERQWMMDTLRPYREQVRFTGWLTPAEMAGWYAAADILVVPSWYEPFGMVVLEGMLHGLAIAASAVGGPAEILEHGRTGWLFPPRNSAALADAIHTLVSDPVARRRIGDAAAHEVRQRWLWPHLVEQMTTVYEEVARTSLPAASLSKRIPPPGSVASRQSSPQAHASTLC